MKNNDLSVKIVAFCLLEMTRLKKLKIDSFGLKNGYWNDKNTKPFQEIVGYSKDTLQRIFYSILEQSPKWNNIKWEKVHLRLNATYFSQFCIIAYQDDFDGYTQLIRFTDGEHYEEIKEDITNLIRLGVQLESITSDGHKSILKAIKKTNKNIIIQRCLVHIQRMCLLWVTRYPKHLSGQELRKLVCVLMNIKTMNDKLFWTK